MRNSIAITGTDTGVGKTVVSCAIAVDAADRGATVRVFKPIVTGVEDPSADTDGDRLRRAARSSQSRDEVTPFVFHEPLAPLAAARAERGEIDLAHLDRMLEKASDGADLLVVEGSGGLLVPITPDVSFATLFRRWSTPIVIVAPNQLGVINHVMLTALAARAEGLAMLGVVLVDRPGDRRDPSADGNRALIEELLPGLPVLPFPWLSTPDDRAALAAAAREAGLGSLRPHAVQVHSA